MTQQADQPAQSSQPCEPGGLIRLRIQVAYDGTAFHGWARQPGLRTVQAELEAALGAALRLGPASVPPGTGARSESAPAPPGTGPGASPVPVRVAVAGRTDTGVHALGQTCHADVPAQSITLIGEDSTGHLSDRLHALLRRLNGILARDLRVRDVALAPLGFDARWSATWREYRYLVSDAPATRDPLRRGHVLWTPGPLDVESMDMAAQPFRGEHDFTAFCRARRDASSVRTVMHLGWRRDPDGLVAFTMRADAFCHSMVRSLVGAFLAVGAGRWQVGRPADLLRAGKRVPEVPVVPAHGLVLVGVGYPDDADVAEQARRAKRWRGRDPSQPSTAHPSTAQPPHPAPKRTAPKSAAPNRAGRHAVTSAAIWPGAAPPLP